MQKAQHTRIHTRAREKKPLFTVDVKCELYITITVRMYAHLLLFRKFINLSCIFRSYSLILSIEAAKQF